MEIVIKKMETEEEILGKAYVHWKSWQEAYAGMIDQRYLDDLTLAKCEAMARRWPENTLVAKAEDRIIGFVAYGKYRNEELEDAGEIFAIYILSDYYGKGVGFRLMQAGLCELKDYACVAVWVLTENKRAIGFYEKCGFCLDGREEMLTLGRPVKESRMMLQR